MSFLDAAPKPPMGWNSWDCYGASVTEDEVKAQADFMAANLLQYGWEYIVVDIQWSEPTANSTVYHNFAPLTMDSYSRLIPAVNRFPSAANGQGFKPLGDYLHEKGLKFGIHIMRGIPRQAVHQRTSLLGTDKTAQDIALNNICPWNSDMYGVDVSQPEGQGYYNSLMSLYASWGVDFLKVDDIADSKLYGNAFKAEISSIRSAIDQTGRPMVLSLSPGPSALKNGSFFQNNANMWRLTDDFWDHWSALKSMFDRTAEWAPFVRRGNWPDCDMLPLGHIGIRAVDGQHSDHPEWTHFTKDEQQLLVTLWTVFQSPLMFGGTLIDLDEFTLGLLTNPAVLKMYHEVVTKQEIKREDDWIVWSAMSSADHYLAYFNLAEEKRLIPLDLQQLADTRTVVDLWRQRKTTIATDLVPAHGAYLIKLES